MKGDAKVIELLNEALRNELTATNQYWLHYRLLDNWGVGRLAAFERSESIDEMKHADRLAERILFLDGLPNFQRLGRLRIGETVEEVLRADLELEMEALGQLKGAIAHCESVRDFVSRDLFSFLFGASLLLVIQKAEAKGESPARVHFRRMLWLLLFGYLHFYFVWYGDILTGYASVGMIAWFYRNKPPHRLLIAGIIFILV